MGWLYVCCITFLLVCVGGELHTILLVLHGCRYWRRRRTNSTLRYME
jgi:hypothetical protein